MAEPKKETTKTYTYAEYLKWTDNEKYELIDGIPHLMTPGPNRTHQLISMELSRQISNYLKNKDCEVYAAPFDVRLPKGDEEEGDIETVVQPDIVVVCDKSKLDDKGCLGSPDLIMEIVSPSTASMDYIKKLNLYEESGVKEYWIIHPVDKIIMIYKNTENGKYGRPEVYQIDEKIKVGIFDDLMINLDGMNI